MNGLPLEAEVAERIQESPNIFTLRLRLTDPAARARYWFRPGQFNMVYLYGVGEVPISIVSDPRDEAMLDHTIRALGRVTNGLAALKPGDRVGVRGPFGRGWPLEEVSGRDVLVIADSGCSEISFSLKPARTRTSNAGVLASGCDTTNITSTRWPTRRARPLAGWCRSTRSIRTRISRAR